MTATQQFIEDAIAGGWRFQLPVAHPENTEWTLSGDDLGFKALMLLDPLAWQAVGKTRGWDEGNLDTTNSSYAEGTYSQDWMWRHLWHTVIDHLADGRSVDEALAAIQ